MTRPHALHLATSLFTIVPVPPTELSRDDARRALLAFPWLGALLGAGAGLVAWGVQAAGGGALLAAFGSLALLALATGGMHLDGLADTADALASRRGPEEAVAIMKRHDIGPMGVGTLVMVQLVAAAALASPRLAAHDGALAAALVIGPAIGRLLALAGTTDAYPPAHAAGFAALMAGLTSRRRVAVSAAAAIAFAAALGGACAGGRGVLVFAGASLLAWAFGAAWRRHLVRRLGGLNGDCWGSLVELGQLVVWVVCAVAV